MNLPDAQNHPGFAYRPETGEEPFASMLAVPVRRAGRTLGVTGSAEPHTAPLHRRRGGRSRDRRDAARRNAAGERWRGCRDRGPRRHSAACLRRIHVDDRLRDRAGRAARQDAPGISSCWPTIRRRNSCDCTHAAELVQRRSDELIAGVADVGRPPDTAASREILEAYAWSPPMPAGFDAWVTPSAAA